MTPKDAAVVLALAATFDTRLTPPSPEDAKARALAWAAALDEDMTQDQGRAAVIEHYRDQTRSLLPADVNQIHRDRAREHRASRLALASPCEHGEPRGRDGCALCRAVA